jgi:hypothetical protein
MKRLLPLLLLLLLGSCADKVEVTIDAPSSDWEVYGQDTIRVILYPYRNITILELMIDSAVVGADTYPGPTSSFVWNVTSLREASLHQVQARATSGSHEYLSPELTAIVGYRSRLLVDGAPDSLWVYRPDGRRDTGFVPLVGGVPVSPRFVVGCESVVFLTQHRLYGGSVPDGEAQPIDSVANGIYSCDASPVSHAKVFDGYPAGIAHLFYKDWFEPKVQLTHDSDYVLIDSSRFTCIENAGPVFSPDGQRIAYYRRSKCLVTGDPHEGETREDVFVMNRSGTGLVNLTPGLDDGYFSGLAWTFDGKWVLFRRGTNAAPDRVLAANLEGHAVEVAGVSPVAMTLSPTDSTLVWIDAGDRKLHSVKLVWTADTLHPSGAVTILADGAFGSYIDWVRYSGQ